MGDEEIIKTDEAGDELTDEEKAILAEDDEDIDDLDEGAEPKEQPDGDEKDKGEPDTDTAPVDDEPHKPAKDNMIPQTEFDRRVGEIRTQAEQKLDFLKRDPEGYYQKYPEEKPATVTGPARPPTDTLDTQAENLIVQGGQYEGMTLKDVMEVDQVTGNRMLFDYWQGQRDEIQAVKDRQSQRREGAQKEVDVFAVEVSKELFSKTDGLTDEETGKVHAVIQGTLNWMKSTGRGFANLSDSYYLMTRDEKIRQAKGDGAKAIADSITRGSVATISSNRSGGADTGYEADLTMTAEQLAAKLDKMSDKAVEKWAKNAPDELKKKYTDMPWW